MVSGDGFLSGVVKAGGNATVLLILSVTIMFVLVLILRKVKLSKKYRKY